MCVRRLQDPVHDIERVEHGELTGAHHVVPGEHARCPPGPMAASDLAPDLDVHREVVVDDVAVERGPAAQQNLAVRQRRDEQRDGE